MAAGNLARHRRTSEVGGPPGCCAAHGTRCGCRPTGRERHCASFGSAGSSSTGRHESVSRSRASRTRRPLCRRSVRVLSPACSLRFRKGFVVSFGRSPPGIRTRQRHVAVRHSRPQTERSPRAAAWRGRIRVRISQPTIREGLMRAMMASLVPSDEDTSACTQRKWPDGELSAVGQ